MRDTALTCSLCAEKRPVVVRLFRYCPECGVELERPTPRVEVVVEPAKPGRVDRRPETAGRVEGKPAAEGETSGGNGSKKHSAARPMRPGTAVVAVVTVVALLGVVAVVWNSGLFGPSAERRIEAVARRGEWTPVRLADAIGKGRAFTVAGDGPIRVRVAGGRPMIVEGPALSLGDLADGSLEIRAVDRETRVTFLAR